MSGYGNVSNSYIYVQALEVSSTKNKTVQKR